ncbi:MAG: hypothetical protein OQK82_08835 [Candidatus Pacearchaeota archaeon]|nr:hypothetical protein [Candidatus Pacearchaeota archaeon]
MGEDYIKQFEQHLEASLYLLDNPINNSYGGETLIALSLLNLKKKQAFRNFFVESYKKQNDLSDRMDEVSREVHELRDTL